MADPRLQLIKCFSAVFPGLTDQEITTASLASVAQWDSVASVTLFAVVEEEFGIKLQPEDLEKFISFELILDCVENRHVKS